MSTKTHNMTYRGDLCGLDANGKTIAFVTQHAEEKASSLYLIDGEANKLSSIPLEIVATSMLCVDKQFWVGGTDNSLVSVDEKSKKANAHKLKLPAPIIAMAPLSDSRIALLAGNSVVIISTAKKVAIAQTIELDEEGTAIASNPDGTWTAIGTKQGTIHVYHVDEDGAELVFSESEKIHEGAVTSILFEPEELRFFSSGADRKLLLTHARGKLEPEDRGRANVHEKVVGAMVLAGDDRLITGGRDNSCKSWARAGATKPQTQASDLVAVTHLAVAEIHKRKNLVVGCHDNSLRLFLIKEDERIGDILCRYNDLYSRTSEMLSSPDPAVRGEAMQELAEYDDRKTAEILAGQISNDSDNKLRLTAAKLLSKSSHPQLSDLFQPHLSHEDAPVRELVLDELVKLKSDSLVELYESAIEIGKADIGVSSIEALAKIASDKKRSDGERNQSQSVIAQALNSETVEIRNSAIMGLEKLFEKKSPRANLLTLDSNNPDSKRKGMIRLFQRDLLGDDNAAAGLRRAVEDYDADVRQTAFLVSVLSRPALAKTLRERDKDIDRQLSEIEKFDFDPQVSGSKKTGTTAVRKKKAAKKKVVKRKPG